MIVSLGNRLYPFKQQMLKGFEDNRCSGDASEAKCILALSLVNRAVWYDVLKMD